MDAPEPPLVVIDYVAPDACPSRTSFRDRVEGRTDRARFVLEGTESPRRAEVRVALTESGAKATVRLVGSAAGGEARTVEGETCSDVVDASALMIAVAVEAIARATQDPPRVPDAAPDRSDGERRATALVFAQGGVVSGLGPELGPAAKIGAGLRASGRFFAPEGRLEARLQSGGDWEGPGARARFSAWGGAASGCPVFVGSGSVRLSPCVGVSAVNLTATASGFADARERSRLHLAMEGGARLSVSLDRAFFELEGWAVLPLQRERYVVGGGAVHETGPVGAATSLGAGVHFR